MSVSAKGDWWDITLENLLSTCDHTCHSYAFYTNKKLFDSWHAFSKRAVLAD